MTRLRPSRALGLSWLFLFFACTCVLVAQSEPDREPNAKSEGGYGLESFFTIVSGNEFFPMTSTMFYAGSTAERYPWDNSPGTSEEMSASLNGRIPEGAVVTQMCVYGFDFNGLPDADLNVRLLQNHVDSGSGKNPGVKVAAQTQNTGVGSGDFVKCVNTDIRFRSRWDIDGDGTVEMVAHELHATLGANADMATFPRLRLVRLSWHREVSPAPAVATFNDVPTTNPYFQFVEAFAAAGLAADCGGNNFCPNSPVTRAEMAVYISKALGLHWSPF